MAATALTVTTLTEQVATVPPAEAAADFTNGNTVLNGPTLWLEMTNTTAAAQTVTVAYANKVDGQTISPRSYSLPATIGAKLRAGVFPVGLFGQTLTVQASATTVTLAAYQLG